MRTIPIAGFGLHRTSDDAFSLWKKHVKRPQRHGLHRLAAQFDSAPDAKLRAYHSTAPRIQDISSEPKSFVTYEMAYCMLLEAGANADELKVFSDCFLYLAKHELDTGRFTDGFTQVIEAGASLNALRLYSRHALELLKDDILIERLTNTCVHSIENGDDLATMQEACAERVKWDRLYAQSVRSEIVRLGLDKDPPKRSLLTQITIELLGLTLQIPL